MKILFIGDVVGRPGRRAVRECLPRLVERHRLDMVIANGENSAGRATLKWRATPDLHQTKPLRIPNSSH
ncbi:YmdB family metallophosphoesterase [Verrucomicrobia bacterium]|nr:YmdB family metallophosphoesterase [Verrucomicrobiota bacterium]